MIKVGLPTIKRDMKKIVTILLLIFVFSITVEAQKRFVMLDKVVAVVGNSSVSYSDVQQ